MLHQLGATTAGEQPNRRSERADVAEETEHRLGFFMVVGQALLDGLGMVVAAGDERAL